MHSRLYTKGSGQRHFRPVDWKTGRQVGNLIHATIFSPEETATVGEELAEGSGLPPGMKWEFRPVPSWNRSAD